MKFLISFLIAAAALSISSQSINSEERYQCLPCGLQCDGEVYSAPGKCSICQMELVKKSTITFKTVEPSDICRYIAKHPSVVLLDVRTKEEFEGTADPNFGTLKNAINIPIGEINNRLNELKKYKNSDVIVFCSHSHRSPQVSYLLTQNGFKNVANMNGGMSVLADNACKK